MRAFTALFALSMLFGTASQASADEAHWLQQQREANRVRSEQYAGVRERQAQMWRDAMQKNFAWLRAENKRNRSKHEIFRQEHFAMWKTDSNHARQMNSAMSAWARENYNNIVESRRQAQGRLVRAQSTPM